MTILGLGDVGSLAKVAMSARTRSFLWIQKFYTRKLWILSKVAMLARTRSFQSNWQIPWIQNFIPENYGFCRKFNHTRYLLDFQTDKFLGSKYFLKPMSNIFQILIANFPKFIFQSVFNASSRRCWNINVWQEFQKKDFQYSILSGPEMEKAASVASGACAILYF